MRILDELSLLACAAYVDLNPIRAALAETLETSNFTSVQRRIHACQEDRSPPADRFLAPLFIDEQHHEVGACPSGSSFRCSDKGFLSIPLASYLELLDWTARQTGRGGKGRTPQDATPILERLSINPTTWCGLIENFGRLFYYVAGEPQAVDAYRGPEQQSRFHMRDEARQLLTTSA